MGDAHCSTLVAMHRGRASENQLTTASLGVLSSTMSVDEVVYTIVQTRKLGYALFCILSAPSRSSPGAPLRCKNDNSHHHAGAKRDLYRTMVTSDTSCCFFTTTMFPSISHDEFSIRIHSSALPP